MKNYVINNGSFTTTGNFSGYTALGERVHLHKRQMDALGFASNADVKFPFYVIADVKMINPWDENKQPKKNADGSLVEEPRLTAMSAFKSREDIKQAHVDSRLLDIEIAQEIKSQATTAGLDEQAVNALAAASI